jgi:hypothetical protein
MPTARQDNREIIAAWLVSPDVLPDLQLPDSVQACVTGVLGASGDSPAPANDHLQDWLLEGNEVIGRSRSDHITTCRSSARS